ncbi:MAG: GIY-YIG nuclease family protein [Sphingobium sp.]
MRGNVYFIRAVGEIGPVKIGYSTDPKSRAASFAVSQAYDYEVVAQMPGDFRTERRFHAMFQADHMRREWFKWSPRLQTVIDQVKAGQFYTANLPDPVRLTTNPYMRTPEYRANLSMTLRVSKMRTTSGHSPRLYGHQVRDALAVSYLEAYLADPVGHGLPDPYDHAKVAAAKFIAKRIAA